MVRQNNRTTLIIITPAVTNNTTAVPAISDFEHAVLLFGPAPLKLDAAPTLPLKRPPYRDGCTGALFVATLI